MIFRQLVEDSSSTYTYLLGCEQTGQCVLVDPVYDTVERDLAVVRELGLRLAFTLDRPARGDAAPVRNSPTGVEAYAVEADQ